MSDGFQLELTGPQFAPLIKGLNKTLTLSQFDRMLRLRLDISREDISVKTSYEDILFDVIDDLNRKGEIYRLVDAAHQERPKVPLFVEYATILGVGLDGLPDSVSLEGIVEANNWSLDIEKVLSRFGEIAGQVCRVDLNGDGRGTGFLVGPDLVLTNYHVVRRAIENESPLNDYTCRFDFKILPGKVEPEEGTIVEIKKVEKSSESAPSKLDYALLRLRRKIGDAPIGDKPTADSAARGWVTMPSKPPTFVEKSPLFIVQHPLKLPMKWAPPQGIIGLTANGTRVRYRTNTEPGASGSPCFGQELELVALHHASDPNDPPQWNQGIPIDLIQAEIKEYLTA